MKGFNKFAPFANAELTVYWFLHGKKYSKIPSHVNCRCAMIYVK